MPFHSKVRDPLKAILPGLFLVLTCSTLLSAERTAEGLLALYDFTGTDGMTIRDRSGIDPALDLKIEDSKAVSRTRGVLKVHGETQIRSLKTATKILNAVRQSGEITVEAWIHPENITQ
ncbi:MAG: hypothetical protein VCA55_04010, partial [Verrucomicrobiales bacterium]